MRAFVDGGGEVLACGTCLRIRHQEGSDACPLSTMEDMYTMVAWADKVVSL